jgi:ADP-heptose:LPS heptosyltransferase
MIDELEVGTFLSVVGHLQLLVTADTFALHAARAQQVPVLALVGPMPHRELELGPADRIIGPALPCAPCYYHCSRPIRGECMRRIPARQVAVRVEELLSYPVSGPPAVPGPSRDCRLRPGSYRGTGGAPRSARREP